MADYKRMVSYMYEYENGVKRKNVGYARVEAKDGQCKITLHIQLLGQLDSIFPTYLIQRDENNIDLIYLGDTVLKNQVMDSKLAADEANIMGSGHSLSDMGGLLIFLNDKVFFATEWDDKPIVAKEVLEAMKPKAKKPSVPKKESNPIEELKEAEKVAIEERSEPSLLEELMIPKYKLPRGWKTVERLQKPFLADASNRNDNALEAADMATEEKTVFEEALITEEVNYIENSTQEATYAEPSTQEVTYAETSTQEISNVEASVTEEANTVQANENCDPTMEGAERPDPFAAQHFFQNYPRIYPFEDNEIILCVKIEPKDIGLLPKEFWTLSNNSFLMHGYYCYHHLIFAKMKDRYGCRYILGIPGIFHNREKFMARMFGFEDFKSIRKRELRQGDFGYWYLPITL